MKKKNTAQTLLEQQIQELLAPWPDPMSRTDFRKACHIGTRTSIYLLESGLVPLRKQREKDSVLQNLQGRCGGLPAAPSHRAGVLHPAQRLVQELPPA